MRTKQWTFDIMLLFWGAFIGLVGALTWEVSKVGAMALLGGVAQWLR